MFVTISMYQVRAGEEDAIVAMYEDWQRTLQPKVVGYLSGEVVRGVENSREFIAITRFESREAAQTSTIDSERETWYQRLMSLTEQVPIRTGYTSEWRAP